MKRAMVVKDHFTGLCYIEALQPLFVGLALDKIFSFMGYPKIMHTDNGKEFTGKVLLRIIKRYNPQVTTVTGRPRHLQEQGSVENLNRRVRQALFSYE
jgi:transposase InsO family protein